MEPYLRHLASAVIVDPPEHRRGVDVLASATVIDANRRLILGAI
jgi:hypothetical protein